MRGVALDREWLEAVELDDERDARESNDKSETERKSTMGMYDERLAEAEAEVDRGKAWKVHEKGVLNPKMPNPLTIIATGWSTVHTQYGEAELLNGTDKDGQRWSVLVGSTVLQKRLIEGLVEEWNEEANGFLVVKTLGKVAPDEAVAIKFLGIKEGANFNYPNYSVARKAAPNGGQGELPEGF